MLGYCGTTFFPNYTWFTESILMKFTQEQLKLIYKTVRYYQMNKTPLDGAIYRDCDRILNDLFPIIHDVSVIHPEL